MGIWGFHDFSWSSTHRIICPSISSSHNFRAFQFHHNSGCFIPIKCVLENKDFNDGAFLIIEKEDTPFLAQIVTNHVKNSQLTLSILSSPLPAGKFSISNSLGTIISTTNIIELLVESPANTMFDIIMLSDAQFTSI